MATAARHRMPTIFGFRDLAMAGGLMSYGIDLAEVYRQLGRYAGRILKGAKAADLPVLQPTKLELGSISRPPKHSGSKFRLPCSRL